LRNKLERPPPLGGSTTNDAPLERTGRTETRSRIWRSVTKTDRTGPANRFDPLATLRIVAAFCRKQSPAHDVRTQPFPPREQTRASHKTRHFGTINSNIQQYSDPARSKFRTGTTRCSDVTAVSYGSDGQRSSHTNSDLRFIWRVGFTVAVTSKKKVAFDDSKCHCANLFLDIRASHGSSRKTVRHSTERSRSHCSVLVHQHPLIELIGSLRGQRDWFAGRLPCCSVNGKRFGQLQRAEKSERDTAAQ